MNDDVRKFIEINNINVSQINSELASHIYTPNEINSITSEYGMYCAKSQMLISVSKILGYDRQWRGIPSNIVESLSSFFDSKGDGYHSRSVGLLKYQSDEILSKLERSFEIEPIIVDEIDTDKYVISTNGLHRYSVLKVHYLNELCKAKDGGIELSDVERKYQIPVFARELDYTKTYCNFLLRENGIVKRVESELDENYRYTGNTRIYNFDKSEIIFTNEQLLEFTKMKMSNLFSDDVYIQYIQGLMSQYETFNEFMIQNFEEIMKKTSGGKNI